MLIDLQEVTETFTQPIRSMVCIAGAGIAGLVLAIALADAGVDVSLLEAGGRRDEDRSQSMYDAEMTDTKHTGTTSGRFRVFGGTSTRWGGQILPYTDDIFSPSATLSTAAWPLSSDELRPFYSRVEEILGVNKLPFDATLLDHLATSLPPGLRTNPSIDLRYSKWAPFTHRNLAQTLGIKAIHSGRITVFLHANLCECSLSADGSKIEAFLVRNYRGTTFRFTADQYVMATGTIETSRLLLASRSVYPNGVGNFNDQVGRRFHDHISAPVATLNGTARKNLLSWMGPFFSKGTTHTGRLEATVELRRRLQLPAIMAHFTIEEPAESGMFVARELLRSVQRGDSHKVLLHHYRRLPAASVDFIRLGYHARIKKRRAISSTAEVVLRIDSEQTADPRNRIRLARNHKDALGILRTVIDWRVSEEEILSMRCYARFLREELNRLGVGPVEWHPAAVQTNDSGFPEIRDTNHPMGGTVMGFDPRQSVVNDDLRVHGVANLYITSCSTFPSGGSSNPTFTLMALALRLSERLTRLVNTPQNFGRVIELVALKERPREAIATSAAAAASSIPMA